MILQLLLVLLVAFNAKHVFLALLIAFNVQETEYPLQYAHVLLDILKLVWLHAHLVIFNVKHALLLQIIVNRVLAIDKLHQFVDVLSVKLNILI